VEPLSCKLSSKPVETGVRHEISQLSCTMRYAANTSYVVLNMIWRIEGSSESPISSTNILTSANITRATSTLNVTWSQNNTCIQKYTCEVGFSLTDKIPPELARNNPGYAENTCSPDATICKSCSPVL